MSENNYGAMMMKTGVDIADDINAISSPGFYLIPPGNNSSPDKEGGILIIHAGPPVRRTFTSDALIALTSTKNGDSWSSWKGVLSRPNPFGDIKSDGPTAVATALSNLGLGTAAKSSVVQTTGQSVTDVISQKGSTDNFALKSLFDNFGGSTLMFNGNRNYSLQLNDSGALYLYSRALDKTVMAWSPAGELLTGTVGFNHVTELKSAAKKDVGNGPGQIPDMTYFPLSGMGTDNLIVTFPNGLIMQVFRRGISNSTTVGAATANPVAYPTPFPNSVWGAFCTKMTFAQINTSCESITTNGFSAVTCPVSPIGSTTSSSAVFAVFGY
ncbi:hypothetical protein ACHHZC_21920 [Citrobacter freundii complex sp. 2024EL-00228]|uniref:gp53-like domain-containing protein n=1 Tax=unclassified Citrobacter freundii complex TaxID=2816438 RepID=UPI00360B3B6E